MIGKILKWGNSYGMRLSKADVEREGLHEGQEVVFELKSKPGQRVDVSDMPAWDLGGNMPEIHDEILYGEPLADR